MPERDYVFRLCMIFLCILLRFSPLAGQEDGFLFTNELTALDLDADLAGLSACNTGSGILKKGEGVVSLARAFHHAGVRAKTHSFWNVPADRV